MQLSNSWCRSEINDLMRGEKQATLSLLYPWSFSPGPNLLSYSAEETPLSERVGYPAPLRSSLPSTPANPQPPAKARPAAEALPCACNLPHRIIVALGLRDRRSY